MSDDIFEEFRETAVHNPVDAVPNPRKTYDQPEDVLQDASLAESEKREILTLWAAELDDRLKAEEEGMSASDPIHNRTEGNLAHEATRVTAALGELTGTADHAGHNSAP